MSGKLDQSLDEILSTRRAVGRGRGRGRARRATTTRSAPVGGVAKNTTKVTGKAAGKTAATTPAIGKDSKIIVSNLPSDVTEAQIKSREERTIRIILHDYLTALPLATRITGSSDTVPRDAKDQLRIKSDASKLIAAVFADAQLTDCSLGLSRYIEEEYFGSNLGSVKKVSITYGPTGISRGVATITFSKPGTANSAAARLNGVLVDGRPMKVEVIVDASRAPPEPVKDISERITKPKVQPKQAGTTKNTESTKRGSTRGARGGRARRGRNAGRSKPKTAEELDAEMTDYFVGGSSTNNTNADSAAAPAANTNGTAGSGTAAAEDLGMDEIS